MQTKLTTALAVDGMSSSKRLSQIKPVVDNIDNDDSLDLGVSSTKNSSHTDSTGTKDNNG